MPPPLNTLLLEPVLLTLVLEQCFSTANIILQFENGLFILTWPKATHAQYCFPSASRQVHAVRIADSFSFSFLLKNVGSEMKLVHNHTLTTSCCGAYFSCPAYPWGSRGQLLMLEPTSISILHHKE